MVKALNYGVEDVSPGLFSRGLNAGSSLAAFSEVESFFSCVELLLPRRPGDRSAGEGSAPEEQNCKMVKYVSVFLSVSHFFFCGPISFYKNIPTVDLISWRKKPDV